MLKVLIALATYNRKTVTSLCLENLKQSIDKNTRLVIYDDASEKYNEEFLLNFSDYVLRFRVRGGIERSRARAFRDFVHIYTDYDLLYITDNDTIHDPEFLEVLRDLYTISSVSYEKQMPIGLFNSVFHAKQTNIIKEEELVSIRKTCPGVSQCYDRSMVSKIVNFLDKNPFFETAYGFDYFWPSQLKVPFIQTKISYLEHFARDKEERGIHSAVSNDPRADFDRDRAINPSPYLEKIREKTIKKILL
tara:strand:+ start:1354 stop:2097 length:744 start_codon:yes stop_codon:yes gene_type:complete